MIYNFIKRNAYFLICFIVILNIIIFVSQEFELEDLFGYIVFSLFSIIADCLEFFIIRKKVIIFKTKMTFYIILIAVIIFYFLSVAYDKSFYFLEEGASAISIVNLFFIKKFDIKDENEVDSSEL